jgi:hypothetical protein
MNGKMSAQENMYFTRETQVETNIFGQSEV